MCPKCLYPERRQSVERCITAALLQVAGLLPRLSPRQLCDMLLHGACPVGLVSTYQPLNLCKGYWGNQMSTLHDTRHVQEQALGLCKDRDMSQRLLNKSASEAERRCIGPLLVPGHVSSIDIPLPVMVRVPYKLPSHSHTATWLMMPLAGLFSSLRHSPQSSHHTRHHITTGNTKPPLTLHNPRHLGHDMNKQPEAQQGTCQSRLWVYVPHIHLLKHATNRPA